MSNNTQIPTNRTNPIDINGDETDNRIDGTEGDENFHGYGGVDTIMAGDGSDHIFGGEGDDSLWGQDGDDYLVGGAGTDQVVGGDGNDWVEGGDDRDLVYGSAGDDRVIGGGGDDSVSGNEGNDILEGNDGDDTLWGGSGNDTLYGGDGDDKLFEDTGDDIFHGGDGNDYLYSDEGNDTVNGDAGNDRLEGGTGNDVLNGGTGTDTAEYWQYTSTTHGVTANLLQGMTTDDGSGGVDTLIDIENIRGSRWGDNLTGDNNNNELRGDGGDDVLNGLGGNDKLLGGSGYDTLSGGDGDDELQGGSGNDTLNGGDGNDLIFGQSGDDIIDGGAGDDRLVGGDGADIIQGGTGSDTVWAGNDNDTVHGGGSRDEIQGGSGDDTIYGDEGNDLLFGQDENDMLFGGIGDDELQGGNGNDTLNGDEGNDLLFGQEGDDVIHGDAGVDRLIGDIGHDQLSGGAGDDRFWGGNGDDTLEGGAGIDSAYFTGNFENYTLTQGQGSMTVTDNVGTDGTDTLTSIEMLYFEDGVYRNGEFSLTADNQRPQAVADSAVTNEGDAVVIDVLENDTDPNTNDILRVSYVDGVDNGSVAINADNTITFTPNDGFVGRENFIYFINDGRGGLAGQRVSVDVQPDIINFEEVGLASYANQDKTPTGSGASGTQIDLAGNSWKSMDIDYTVTANTVIRFDFSSDQRGELYGVGLDTDNNQHSGDRFIQIAGKHSGWAQNGPDYTGDGEMQTFEIRLSDYYDIGTSYSQLFFVADDDARSNAHAVFDNVAIFEVTSNEVTYPDAPTINFEEAGLASYANQDKTPTGSGASGTQIDLAGNSWKSMDIDYTVTANTVIRFDFSSDQVGELYGVGLDTDNNQHSGDRFIQIAGKHSGWAQNGPDYTGDGEMQTFEIRLSDYYDIGTSYSQLFFVADDDATSNAHAVFDNVSIIENGTNAEETLVGSNADEVLYGQGGDDDIFGQGGDDILYGGDGMDGLYGQGGADTFVFDKIDESDFIMDLNFGEGDKIDISDLLEGYDPLADAIGAFVQITEVGEDSVLVVDTDGGADNFVQVAALVGVTGLSDVDALVTNGDLIVT